MKLAARQIGTVLVCGLLPALLLALTWKFALFGFDFRIFLDASRDVMNGASPFPAPRVEELRNEDQYVYPPLLAVLLVPLVPLGESVASGAFFVTNLLATVAACFAVGVRDWRIVGAILLWPATVLSLMLGTINPLLALLLALAWRWRDQSRGGVALALAVALKVFLAPMLLWLIMTGRWKSSVVSVATMVVAVLGPWALIGFDGISHYGQLLETLERLQAPKSFSPAGVVLALGGSTSAAHAASIGMALVMLAGMFLAARRGRDERLLFALALFMSLLLSPVVWLHYFMIVCVPMALMRRTLAVAWFIPLLTWPLVYWQGFGATGGDAWRAVAVVAIMAAALVEATRRRHGGVARAAGVAAGR